MHKGMSPPPNMSSSTTLSEPIAMDWSPEFEFGDIKLLSDTEEVQDLSWIEKLGDIDGESSNTTISDESQNHSYIYTSLEKYHHSEEIIENCKKCNEFFKDIKQRPAHDRQLCYPQMLASPEAANILLGKTANRICDFSQCFNKKCVKNADYFLEKQSGKQLKKQSSEEQLSEEQPSEEQFLEEQSSEEQFLEEQPLEEQPSEEQPSPKLKSLKKQSLPKLKSSPIKVTPSIKQPSPTKLKRSPIKMTFSIKQKSSKRLSTNSPRCSVSILKSNTNMNSLRQMDIWKTDIGKQLQPTATRNFQLIRDRVLMPKQLESDGDSPRSESPQSYSDEERMRFQDQLETMKSKLYTFISSGAVTASRSMSADENNSMRARQRCAQKKDNAVLTDSEICRNTLSDHCYTTIEWRPHLMTDSTSESESDIDVVSFNKRVKQPKKPVSTAQPPVPVSTVQPTEPVSTVQPTAPARRRGRPPGSTKSANKKRALEGKSLSPPPIPAKRTRREDVPEVPKKTEAKRNIHNQKERQRRGQLKRFQNELHKLIPGIAKTKASKIAILDGAFEYINELITIEKQLKAIRQQHLLQCVNIVKEGRKSQNQCNMLGISAEFPRPQDENFEKVKLSTDILNDLHKINSKVLDTLEDL